MTDELQANEPKPLKDEEIVSEENAGRRSLMTVGALLAGGALLLSGARARAQNKRTDPDQKKHKRTDPDQKKHHRTDPDQKKKKHASKSDPDRHGARL